jgi:16S rRNA (adenine1518-N6/adenine1519-N6)-dimethyltransferase
LEETSREIFSHSPAHRSLGEGWEANGQVDKIKLIKNMAKSHGIYLKKKYGQHFLRDQQVVEHMLDHVDLTPQSSVLEIGCGDGFLTQEIVKHPMARFWIFEIDPQWTGFVKNAIPDKRIAIHQENILDVDFKRFEPYKPWTVLSNLPYQITFPILYLFQANRGLFKEGVIMIQEEVAQKIVKTSGRGYGFPSLFFQYYFDWKLLQKVRPGAFIPPPNVYSRLLYFKPKENLEPIPEEEKFWQFIKHCFVQPRRTLRNNLQQFHYNLMHFSDQILGLRAQQMKMQDFLRMWKVILSVNEV